MITRSLTRCFATVAESKRMVDQRVAARTSMNPDQALATRTSPPVPQPVSNYIIPERPAVKGRYCFRDNSPAFDTMTQILQRPLHKNSVQTAGESTSSKTIWMLYGGTGLSIATLCSFVGAPLFGVVLGGYLAGVGGSLAKYRASLFGGFVGGETGCRELPYSVAGEIYENLTNYSLLINAEAALRPWSQDLLDQYDPLRRSLTGYTSLQQLVVKEPIVDRSLAPRVVSGTSARVIWNNLLAENVFYLEQGNPWTASLDSGEKKLQAWYIRRCLHPRVNQPRIAKHGIDRHVDGGLRSFDLFYESFLQHSLLALAETGNSRLVDRDWPWLLGSGILVALPFL